MKKTNLVITALAALSLAGSVASCGAASGETLPSIGILQLATHDALDYCREGFISALEEGGFKDGENCTIEVQNPEGNASTMATMSRNFALSKDLVFGIATNAALSLKTALADYGKSTPLLFSAVTDPVSAGLVASFTDHANVTGTSDAGPTAKNIELFKDFGIDKIGVIFNTAESNSQIQFDEAVAAGKELGIDVEGAGITSATQITSRLEGLIAKGVKGVFIPTDNMVAGAIKSIKEEAIENKIVLVCADESITNNGGSLGYTVDYRDLGETTGKMAVQILKGEAKVEDIDVSYSATFPLIINQDFFTESGIEIPQAVKDKAGE